MKEENKQAEHLDYIKSKIGNKKEKKYNFMLFVTFTIGVILIVATYAWFFASLDVKIKTFNMVVSNDSGLSISFDGINYDSSVEISEETLIKKLKSTYANNTSQWASSGLTPVSSSGISSNNNSKFDMYRCEDIGYINSKRETRYLSTGLINEEGIKSDSKYIAFDLFLKNVTGSPMPDNLYLDSGTGVSIDKKSSDEMDGLINSIRFGFVKIGSVPLKSEASTIQNVNCNGNCSMTIYEPNANSHSNLSIERAKEYGIHLVDGISFPTYSVKQAGKEIDIRSTISGSVALDEQYFGLQNTQTNIGNALFQIPDGITKVRVYVWIEGQDIDSLEATKSDGADISININLIKDTAGYDYYE